MRLSLVLLSAVSMMTLSACAPIARGSEQIADAAHNEAVRFDEKVRDWFDDRNEGVETKQPKEPQTAYCYSTLGETECYAKPQAGQELRLAGKQEPAPIFGEYDYPAPEAMKPAAPAALASVEPSAGSTVVQDGDVVYEVPAANGAPAGVPDYRMPREIPAPF